MEPPASGQVERVVASGFRRLDEAFAAAVAARLGPVVCGRLEDLLRRPDVRAELKSDPGPLGLDTLLTEIGKLATVRALGLAEVVFTDTSDRIVAAWRARAARMYPSDFADCPDPAVRYTLLAVLCWTRQAELVDGLVELLIGLIHRINARAERRMEKELIGALTNVPGKRTIFTKMVDAALERPDDTVREALYPVVPGGVMTLKALARELKATERALAERVRYQLRGSYSHYYRRMLAPLLAALEAGPPGQASASVGPHCHSHRSLGACGHRAGAALASPVPVRLPIPGFREPGGNRSRRCPPLGLGLLDHAGVLVLQHHDARGLEQDYRGGLDGAAVVCDKVPVRADSGGRPHSTEDRVSEVGGAAGHVSDEYFPCSVKVSDGADQPGIAWLCLP